MPESVFTQTMPLLFAGGVCCCAVGADFSVEADLLDEPEEPEEELAGAELGAGDGVGAGLEVELALDEPDELELELVAGCDASAEVSDFFVRFFLVVVALLSAAAELAAGVEASAEVSDFLERFFLVVVLESLDAELSAAAAPEEASAEVSDFFDRFFFVVVEPESVDAELSAVAD